MQPPDRKLLTSAALLGGAGDYLLRGGTWRLGFALWIAVICLCAATLGPRITRERAWLLMAIALAPVGLVLRDAEMLYVIDMLSLLCIAAITIWHGSGRRIGELSIIEVPRAALLAALNSAGDGMTSGSSVAFRRMALSRFPSMSSNTEMGGLPSG